MLLTASAIDNNTILYYKSLANILIIYYYIDTGVLPVSAVFCCGGNSRISYARTENKREMGAGAPPHFCPAPRIPQASGRWGNHLQKPQRDGGSRAEEEQKKLFFCGFRPAAAPEREETWNIWITQRFGES